MTPMGSSPARRIEMQRTQDRRSGFCGSSRVLDSAGVIELALLPVFLLQGSVRARDIRARDIVVFEMLKAS